jgi:hypothetical protein
MFDPKAPSSLRAQAELAKAGTRKRLLSIAHWFARNPSDDEDLVAAALEITFDPGKKPWTPPPAFFEHMAGIIKDVAIEAQRRGHGRFEKVSADRAHDPSRPDPAPLPDDALSEHEEAARRRRLGLKLRASVEGIGVCVQVLDCVTEGLEDTGAIAQRIGCTVEDIYQAHRTLKLHGRRILAEEKMAEAAQRVEAMKPSKSPARPEQKSP